MPASMLQHNSNQQADSDVFVNDYSSRKEVEARRVQHEVEKAAKQRADQSEKDKAAQHVEQVSNLERQLQDTIASSEKEKRQLESEWREKTSTLEKEKRQLENEWTEKSSSLEKSNAGLQKRYNELETRANESAKEALERRNQLDEANKTIASLPKPISAENNLDPLIYHGKTVYIVNPVSRTAVDCGAGKLAILY